MKKIVLFISLIFFTTLLFIGCASYNELMHESGFDVVIGDNYEPAITKWSANRPATVLFLPMQKGVDPVYSRLFFEEFQKRFIGLQWIVPRDWDMPYQLPKQLKINDLVKKYGCDAILMIKMEHLSAYPPIRVTAEVILEQVEDGLTLWKGVADYDAGEETVANSARRYTQKVLNRKDAPDSSLYILRDNRQFIPFAAYDLAMFLNGFSAPKPTVIPKPLPDKNK
jgi:hypothetical protein